MVFLSLGNQHPETICSAIMFLKLLILRKIWEEDREKKEQQYSRKKLEQSISEDFVVRLGFFGTIKASSLVHILRHMIFEMA